MNDSKEVEPVSTSLNDVRLVSLPRINDVRGNLTFVEAAQTVPFEIKRAYWLYDVPGGETRGGHAHKTMQQFLVAASGSFSVRLHDGHDEAKYFLNRSYHGLYIPKMMWRELDDFSSGSVCLALVSTHYDESDYYRDFQEFIAATR